MLNITIKNKIFTFPSDWSEVTLRNYIDIQDVGADKNLSSLDIFIKSLSVLCGDKQFISLSQEISLDEFKQIQDVFEWIATEPYSPVKKDKFFLIGNEKWSIKENYDKLTVGESISIEIMLKDKKIDLTPLEMAFGVLFRRVKDDGSLENFNPDDMNLIIKDYSKLIKITDVYRVLNFFLPGEKTSSNNSQGFSISPIINQTNTQLKRKVKKNQTPASTGGVGLE